MKADSPSRVGVCLSSGFFGFFCHAGFIAGLEENGGVEIAALGGSSAGGVVAAMRAAGMDHATAREILFSLKTTDVLDLAGPRTLLRRGPGVVAGQRLHDLLAELLPCARVEDCPVPLVVSTYDIDTGELRRHTTGGLAEVLVATCAVPYFFAPWRLPDGHLHWDGGVVDKTPVDAVSALAPDLPVVAHYLPSRRPTGSPWAATAPLDTLRVELDRVHREQTADRVPLHWVETVAPALGPFKLRRGPEAYEMGLAAGRRAALLCRD